MRARAARTGRPSGLDAYIARHYPAYWLKVDLPHKVAHARFLRAADEAEDNRSRPRSRSTPSRGVTELTVLAPDHPRLLSIIAGACAAAGANIVDAQIFTTTDGLALDTISYRASSSTTRTRSAAPRASPTPSRRRCAASCKLPEVVAKRARRRRAASRPSRIEPEVTINNQWSNRYTVIEVTGLDRPGLLYELTATLSKLNLNIASAHVATFGERVVDVFYVTDLMGAKIASPHAPGGDQARAVAAVRAGRAEPRQGRDQARGLAR